METKLSRLTTVPPLVTVRETVTSNPDDPGSSTTSLPLGRVGSSLYRVEGARKLLAAEVLAAVSYTHLTLPTNREV